MCIYWGMAYLGGCETWHQPSCRHEELYDCMVGVEELEDLFVSLRL